MWEFFSKLVDALPAWFLVVLVTALLAAAAWILPHLRRDKNGKLYVYSRSYEAQQKRQKEQGKKIEQIGGTLTSLEKRANSIECENLKQTFYIDNPSFPKAERLIAGLKYVYNGGNGAVREDVAQFVADNPAAYKEVIAKFPQWALSRKAG